MQNKAKDLFDPLSISGTLGRVSSALVRAGADFWVRSLDIGARNLARAARTAISPALDDTESENAVDAMIEIYRQYLGEMTVTPAIALHRFREELDASAGGRLLFCAGAKFGTELSDTNPNLTSGDLATFALHGIKIGKPFSVDRQGDRRWLIRKGVTGPKFTIVRRSGPLPKGKGRVLPYAVFGDEEGSNYRLGTPERSVILPARVRDAAQGFVVYRAARDSVQDLLDTDPIVEQTGVPLRTWDIGSGDTPIAIFLVDYRETDLGSYQELGIACFVSPQDDALALGMHFLTLYVNDPFSCDAGRKIWGFPKELARLDFDYKDKKVSCTLVEDGKDLLELTLPRSGSASSAKIPFSSYTLKKDEEGNCFLVRTTFKRSGNKEMIRVKPKEVMLKVLNGGQQSPHGLHQLLFALGIDKNAKPLLCSWTEHMSGEFSAPRFVNVQD